MDASALGAQTQGSGLSTSRKENTDAAATALQNMIREKRTARHERFKLDDREVQTSPPINTKRRGNSSSGTRQPSSTATRPAVQKEMGLREMQDHITRVDKQNFDLKLEVFHRRQRNETLEKKVAEMEKLEASFDDLQDAYDALLLKYDKQQLVLDDAVANICDLEAENDELQVTVQGNRPASTSSASRQMRAVSQWAQEHTPEAAFANVEQKSLHNGSDLASRVDQKRVQRNSLSSLYGLDHQELDNYEPDSLLSNASDDDEDQLDPLHLPTHRLSILSESGFSSIYGSPKESPKGRPPSPDLSRDHDPVNALDDFLLRPASPPPRAADHSRDAKSYAKNSATRKPASSSNRSEHYSSIGLVLDKVPSSSSSSRQQMSSQAKQAAPPRRVLENRMGPPVSAVKQAVRPKHSLSVSTASRSAVGGMFPPTPETMSSTTVGRTSSTQSIITEKSLRGQSHRADKAFASISVDNQRPLTSGTLSSDNSGHYDINSGLQHLTPRFETSSTRGQKSDPDLPSSAGHARNEFPFFGGQMHPDGIVGAKRPPMVPSSSQSNAAGSALVEPTRAFAYHLSQSSRPAPPVSPVRRRTAASTQNGSPAKIPVPIEKVTRRVEIDETEASKDANTSAAPSLTSRATRLPFGLLRRNRSQNAHTVLQHDETRSGKQGRTLRSSSVTRQEPPAAAKMGKETSSSGLRSKLPKSLSTVMTNLGR